MVDGGAKDEATSGKGHQEMIALRISSGIGGNTIINLNVQTKLNGHDVCSQVWGGQ
jgi:hypothetical protein